MTPLLISLALVLTAYVGLMYLAMKRMIPWRYKAFIYGALTFFMLIGVFLVFGRYETSWKSAAHAEYGRQARSTLG